MADSIAILGGTGKEGSALARRWARAGRDVILGSRDAARAASIAAEVVAAAGGNVRGLTNAEACAAAGTVVVATPFEGLAETIAGCAPALEGKLVVSAVIPLEVSEGRFTVRLVPEGSAAHVVAARAPGARVAAAFHNVSYKILADLEREIEEDVPFTAAAEDAGAVRELCSELGARGVHVGGLHLAPYLEGYTAVLLSVNRLYRTQAGVRFTGLPEAG
ncbi:MAG: 8-hydroxy-5-deazaflavin:NADPH oxidoreductase [Chloroflexota bacterium]|jgi:NADPH-dependent F420 reductase|nr:8-hydroxy-5-deazaflavin:NADPH oxidoreductase [Chloroflexota bacterium]